jgi:P-type Na+/K+ transporter
MGVENDPVVEESTEPPICGLTNAASNPAGPGDQRQTLNPNNHHPPQPAPNQSEKTVVAAAAADSNNDTSHPHTIPFDALEHTFQTSIQHGLSGAEAARRLEQDGPNTVEGAKGVSVWKIFLRQISNSLTLVLFAVMAISFAISDFIEGGVIAAVIVLNIVVG